MALIVTEGLDRSNDVTNYYKSVMMSLILNEVLNKSNDVSNPKKSTKQV